MLAAASVWDRRKGIAELENLAGMLREDEELVIIGQMASREKLPRRVQHRLRTESADEMAALYSAADLFLNPTLEDNYPSTNLEALSCGTPVITYASGGSGEAIERGEGMALDLRTPEALRSAIDAVRGGSTLKRDSQSLLRESPGGPMIEQYLALYRDVAKPTDK
jgi:glycosyltransferase involved in cell wall biosynthesis